MTQVSDLKQIRKRNGKIVEFDSSKISSAINKAIIATPNPDKTGDVGKLTEIVVERVSKYNSPTVEDVQDIVESVLIEEGLHNTAKCFILYRHERRKVRDEKKKVLNRDVLDDIDEQFDLNSLRVLASRYLLRDSNNEIIESPKQLFERVAITVGIPDLIYDPRVYDREGFQLGFDADVKDAESYYNKLDNFDMVFKIGEYRLNKYHLEGLIRLYVKLAKLRCMRGEFRHILTMLAEGKFDEYAKNIKRYYDLMINKDFLPNTPTLMNAGAKLGQLSACFVLDMKDNMEDIMKTATDAALIFKSGGGVGINYSDLRPEGDVVASTSGVASGPTSFMNIIDAVTNVVKQGGKRRGANMGILDDTHPDLEKFITSKTKPGVFENFNISVGIHDVFWNALTSDNHKYNLVNPRTGKDMKQADAHQIIDLIALSAWKSAEPGVIFFDNINKYNPLIEAKGGPLRATNPCGEQSLYPYESCNLGSINLSNFVKNGEFDYDRYDEVIRLCTRFLDNVIDMNKYPVEEIDYNTKLTRRIGVGIMGLADALFLMKTPYNSEAGYNVMNKLAEILSYVTMDESITLSEERGPFPLFDKSGYKKGELPVAGYYDSDYKHCDWGYLKVRMTDNGIRNAWTTTIAPTGTLSMLADTSNGVEPLFSAAFEKRVTVGSFYYTNKIFEQVLRDRELYSEELLAKIANNYGSVKGLEEIPQDIQDVFTTAIDIHWVDHVMAQAVWQKWISNAIAKTINMSGNSTTEDVKAAYLIAHELGLKGVTVYRDGSRHEQVLHVTGNESKETKFEVKPSQFTLDIISKVITNPYIKSQIEYMSGSGPSDIEPPAAQQTKELIRPPIEPEESNGHACPHCKESLVVTEGCKMCINCGFSACAVG